MPGQAGVDAGAGAEYHPGMESPGDSERSVAVVFLHGMGEQRRYADTARLATRLAWRAGAPTPGVGLAWRDDLPGTPRARAVVTAELAGRHVVFHDAYWAPLVSGQTNFRSLVRWLRGRALRPIAYLAARWASQPELKISTLQEDRSTLDPIERDLVDDYVEFAGEARARAGPWREGRFGAFLRFLEARHSASLGAGGPGALEAREQAARQWVRRFRSVQFLTLARSGPLLVALFAVLLGAPLTAAWLAGRVVHATPDLVTNLKTLLVATAWLGLFPLARLLVDTLGDVEVYATYTEASGRHRAHEAVLAEAVLVLRRALEDPGTDRVVLVGHSLGSVVGWDALRALVLEAAAGGPIPSDALLRLERVVTYGSPVDKIRYYHFMDDNNDPTFARVLEAQRADTMAPPFDRRPGGLAWDNYYDPADLVAGRLESPNDQAMAAPVRNIAVACGALPNPFTTHLGYLDQDEVLDGILGAIDGRPQPAPSSPRALRPRAWATAAELLLPAALIAWFVAHSLWPVLARAGEGDPLGWLALVLLLVTLLAFA